MGEIEVTEALETNDLLSLIGMAIEQLRQSVELFENSSRAEGANRLSSVIHAIDTYMERAHEDPLLRLARIDESNLAADLGLIKQDLAAVIAQFPERPSP
jgi:uncharacterized protein YqeY